MTNVHMICGKAGAGKTTYARRLEEERRSLLLSLDEWMLHLYDEHMTREASMHESTFAWNSCFGSPSGSFAWERKSCSTAVSGDASDVKR